MPCQNKAKIFYFGNNKRKCFELSIFFLHSFLRLKQITEFTASLVTSKLQFLVKKNIC